MLNADDSQRLTCVPLQPYREHIEIGKHSSFFGSGDSPTLPSYDDILGPLLRSKGKSTLTVDPCLSETWCDRAEVLAGRQRGRKGGAVEVVSRAGACTQTRSRGGQFASFYAEYSNTTSTIRPKFEMSSYEKLNTVFPRETLTSMGEVPNPNQIRTTSLPKIVTAVSEGIHRLGEVKFSIPLHYSINKSPYIHVLSMALRLWEQTAAHSH